MRVGQKKIIWTCWFQGRHAAPPLVQRCFDSWERENPEWELRCLDATTIARYVDFSDIDLNRQTITAASLSDILRIRLLHEFGGVWVDATLYCNRPLDNWLPQVMSAGFFAFSAPVHGRLLSSWFLAAEPGNEIVQEWCAAAQRYWQGRERSDDYYWFHHIAGQLVSENPQVRQQWSSVPAVSADGPHALQFLGLHRPWAEVSHAIDWSTPVFKLTYRVNPEWLGATYLLGHFLERHPATPVHPVSEGTVTEDGVAPAAFAALKVSTENIGDHLQIIAALGLMQRLGIETKYFIDRDDEIATAPMIEGEPGPVGIVMNGWFKTNAAEWPPHPKLAPVFLGFHIRLFQCPTLVSPEAIDYYRKHGPVGCRDEYTVALLQQHGVDAFESHCLTLTYPRRYVDPAQQAVTFVVSRDEEITKILPRELGEYIFVSHYSGDRDFVKNLTEAGTVYGVYRQHARVMITTLLHCALPAIAMGIPVVVFYPKNSGAGHESDVERFSSLRKLIPIYHLDRLDEVDWRGHVADVGALKLGLLDKFYALASRWSLPPAKALGPIAPSSELPVPVQDRLPDAADALPEGNDVPVPDRQKWGNPDSYKPEWDSRAALAAGFVPDGASVLEIGVGKGAFRGLVREKCDRYLGMDLEPLDRETRKMNLDVDDIPEGDWEFIALLGVFEYLHLPLAAISKVCDAAKSIVTTYCFRRNEILPGESMAERGQRGWVNDLNEQEFVSFFFACGYELEEIIPYNGSATFEQKVMLFRKP